MKKKYTAPRAIDLSALSVVGYDGADYNMPVVNCRPGSSHIPVSCRPGSSDGGTPSCAPTGNFPLVGNCHTGMSPPNQCTSGSLDF